MPSLLCYSTNEKKTAAAVCASINNNEWAVSCKSTFRNPKKNKMNTNDYVTEYNNLFKLWCGTHTSSAIVMLNLNLLHLKLLPVLHRNSNVECQNWSKQHFLRASHLKFWNGSDKDSANLRWVWIRLWTLEFQMRFLSSQTILKI